MKHFLTLIGFFLAFTLSAQEEAANWQFGNGAGLQFDLVSDTVTPINSSISTNEGCSSISDDMGNLLFYTDGRTVWNANNQIMSNANYFGGNGLLGDPSSTSSGLIVPHPNDSNLYYIFTVDEPHHNNAWAYPNQGPADQSGNSISNYQETFGDFQTVPNDDDGFNNGFNYSLVDMTLNGGLGDVVATEKNVHLVTYDPADTEEVKYQCAEKITAVEADDCSSIWVITQFIDTFYAFKIDDTGINTTPVTSTVMPTITTAGYRRNGIGYLKASPNGSKLAICHSQNSNQPSDDNSSTNSGSVWLYDFDNATGIVSNAVALTQGTRAYGVEFSPNSSKVYASLGDSIVQFDIDNSNALTQIHNASGGFLAALQLGPNGKIYICNANDGNTLDVIEQPNEVGVLCDYRIGGQNLLGGTDANLGLPPFIASFFKEKIDIIKNNISTSYLALCNGETYTLMTEDLPGATYTWTQDGMPLTESDFDLVVSAPGLYQLNVASGGTTGCLTLEGEALVEYFNPAVANPITNLYICDDNNDSTWDFDFTQLNDQALLLQDTNTYNLQYFTSLEDAQNNENAITGTFTNTENPQTIWYRVGLNNNTTCFDIATFNIEVFNTPTLNMPNAIVTCDSVIPADSDPFNGQTEIDLSTLYAEILGDQDTANYTITFHATAADADAGDNDLPTNYYNTTALNDEVYIRIENNLVPDCYRVSNALTITVNPMPQALNYTLIQCDEDGLPDGFTTYNLLQAQDQIANGVTDVTLSFYITLADLTNDEDVITNPEAFENWSNPQTLYVKVDANDSDCYNTTELILQQSTTAINDYEYVTCDELDSEDGINTIDLSTIESNMQTENGITFPILFFETYQDALLEQNPLSNSYTNTTAYNQTIYARTENNNACYGIAEVTLTINPLPQLEEDNTIYYCLNNFPTPTVINSGVINFIPNFYFFEWSSGEDTIEIEVNETGTYTVTVTNVLGCEKSRTVTVEASNIATIDNIVVNDGNYNNTNTLTVLTSGEGDYEYALYDIYGNEYLPYQSSNSFTDVYPGIYTVLVKDVKNDCGIAENDISVIGFPKFMTPNADGYNDTWQVRGLSTQFQPNSKIYIFDRSGKLLSQLEPLGPGWDGTYNGRPMPSDDYWFSVTLQDGRTFKNHFSLKR